MTLKLAKLESQIPEHILNDGEILLTDNLVSDLSEVHRHFWVAKVQSVETEIQITPARVKAFSCECHEFSQSKICSHVVATMLAIRKKLLERNLEKQPGLRPVEVYNEQNKLTINSILQQTSERELAAFIKSYANSNRQFALILKSHFASKIQVTEPDNKYRHLLDSVIAANRNSINEIKSKGASQLLKVSESLLEQAIGLIAEQDYAEAFIILKVLIEKICQVIRKCGNKRESLQEVLLRAAGQLKQFSNLLLAPALKQEIVDFLISFYNRPASRVNKLQWFFFEALSGYLNDRETAEKFLISIEQELGKENTNSTWQIDLMHFRMLTLASTPISVYLRRLEAEALKSPESLSLHLEKAELAGRLDWAITWCKKGLVSFPKSQNAEFLENKLIHLIIQSGKKKQAIPLLESHFVKKWDLEILWKMKQCLDSGWIKKRDEIIQKIKDDAPENIKHDLLATIYSEEKLSSELFQYLKSENSLELLMKYDSLLQRNLRSALCDLYEEKMSDYLQSHLGLVPAMTIRRILNHLELAGMKKEASSLFAKLQKRFPGRLAVSNDLEKYLEEIENQ
jgi:hypothetical protein